MSEPLRASPMAKGWTIVPRRVCPCGNDFYSLKMWPGMFCKRCQEKHENAR